MNSPPDGILSFSYLPTEQYWSLVPNHDAQPGQFIYLPTEQHWCLMPNHDAQPDQFIYLPTEQYWYLVPNHYALDESSWEASLFMGWGATNSGEGGGHQIFVRLASIL